MALSPSLSWRTRFQSFLKPALELKLAQGFSFNSVSPPLKPTNYNNKKKIESKFQSFTPPQKLRSLCSPVQVRYVHQVHGKWLHGQRFDAERTRTVIECRIASRGQ